MTLPYPSPRQRFCHTCGRELNHYGVCPPCLAQAQQDRINAKKALEEKHRKFQELLDNVFRQNPDKT